MLKLASVYSCHWIMLNIMASRIVRAVPTMAWLLFWLMSSWCALVTHAPLFSSNRVFSSGSSRGCMVSMLLGGQTHPSAVFGWLAESSSAQNMAAKIMASEIMKSKIPSLWLLMVLVFSVPSYMLSRYMSLSQLTVTARRIHIPGLISVIALEYWWLQLAMLIMVPLRFMAASSGHGDLFTRCHEWRVVFMSVGYGFIEKEIGFEGYCY